VSLKILATEAAKRHGVNERTIYRYVKKYEIHRFEDGSYDRDQIDALFDNYAVPGYRDIDWDQAACKDLPTDFFYKIEERGVAKVIDVQIFRKTCAPCPIWKLCLGYATRNEDYGVWGGMVTEERRAVSSRRNSDVKTKVIKDFAAVGISKSRIYEAIGRL
jgi:hypothetical protein